ncbi:MAG: isopenicillin N synthase family oxygenase [candidate division Zixibacteria bacterium]|nr:isopenicillin N synthase family oxygenase [candidate division Zixibacteria bacterium]
MSSIPVIDLSPLHDGSEAGLRTTAERIRDVYSSVGFAYIVGHGVSVALVERAFDAHHRFHALPESKKLRISVNTHHRGYIAINTSTVVTSRYAKVTRPNQSESFMMMHELASDDPDVAAGRPLAGPNQWPDLPRFREEVTEYNDTLKSLCGRLRRAFSVALGGAPDDLDACFEHPTTFLRMLHYPPLPDTRPDDLYGSAPHTDYGFITVLAQDDIGGLQVLTPNGVWIDVPPMPDAFILNTGDLVPRWSNGLFLSTPHRVYNRQDRDRYSIAFFYDPHMTTTVACLPGCTGPGHPTQYDPVVYGDYLMERLNRNHDYRKEKI